MPAILVMDVRMPARSTPKAKQDVRPPRLPGMIGYVIRRAQLAVFRDFLAATEDLAITPAQFSLLTIVEERPGMKQIELSAALEVKRANLVTMLDVMETRGLIARRVVSTDARSHAVDITVAGRKLLRRLDGLVTAHEDKITSGLSRAECAELIRLLSSVIASSGNDAAK